MSAKLMIDTQIISRGIHHSGVLAAMLKVDRRCFVPHAIQKYAYSDCPLPIEEGQTISQPYMVALMSSLLDIQPQSRVLEIGTGCGYQTAILAELADQVHTVEIIPHLATSARQRLTAMNYTNIRYREGDGHEGWLEQAPFDVIIVTAAPPVVPPALISQLAMRGRLLIPVGPLHGTQVLRLIEKDERGHPHERDLKIVRFVPLVKAR